MRRSNASTIAPPYSPKATSGTNAKSPTSPTANDESVIAKTWIATATAVICWPRLETVRPNHSRR